MATTASLDRTDEAIRQLLDKEAIRELVLLYSRAIDRQDFELLRDLYTADGTDTHGDSFDGSADEFCKSLAEVLPSIEYTGHHMCNHLISVEGDEGYGEVYALAYHYRAGDNTEDVMAVRYLDRYRREGDGKWRFASRVVTFDFQTVRPFQGGGLLGSVKPDPSYEVCANPLFQRGARR